MPRWLKRTLGVLAVLSVVLLGVGLWWWLTPDPQMVRVRALQQELVPDKMAALSPEERRQKFDALRTEVDKLPADKRQQAMSEGFSVFRKRMKERVDKYFTLTTPAEQTAYLDNEIREMEQMRKQFMAGGGPGLQGGTNRGGPGSFPPPPGAPGGPGATPDDMLNRRKTFMSETSPDERARVAEFMRQMMNRRNQLGLPALPFGPPQ